MAYYAVGSVSISMNTKHEDYEKYSVITEDMDNTLKDIIFSVVGNYTRDEARENSEQLREDILMRIQEYLGSDVIYAVQHNFLYG